MLNIISYEVSFSQGVPEQKLRAHLGSLGVTGNLALQPMYTLSGIFSSAISVYFIKWRIIDVLYLVFDVDPNQEFWHNLLIFKQVCWPGADNRSVPITNIL